MSPTIDARGRELHPGDLVLYPVRHGSMVKLVEGYVMELLSSTSVLIERFAEIRWGQRKEVKVPKTVRVGTSMMVLLEPQVIFV
jgi:hypothetical protein